MKKVLVTGAAGTVGIQVLRFLLSEGKYEVTVLELKNIHVYKRLKKFRKRINIVYGDVNDSAIIDALVKDHDVVIHLAGILPPFANVKENIVKFNDYEGTINIVEAIKNYNPRCYLLYPSSTSVYGVVDDMNNITTKSKGVINEYDYYSKYKICSEQYIRHNLKNYTIFRMSYVLCDLKSETAIYNVPKTLNIETISSEDAGYAFVAAIDFKSSLNRKIYNLSGGSKYCINYRDYLIKILKNYGLTLSFLSAFLFAEKNYYGGIYVDGDKLNEILNFRTKDVNLYYEIIEEYRSKFSRFLPRLFALPFIFYLNLGKKK